MDLAYDGAPFAGFARQAGQTTVQGALEGALCRLLRVDAIETRGAGRTDRGVHALAQVVHVDVPERWRLLSDLERARTAIDHLVGPAITVFRVRRVPESFDARFSATQRRYRYRVWDGPTMEPLLRHDTWHVPGPLDVEAMHRAGQALLGEHDFSSFCRRPDPGATLVRRIDRLSVRRSRPAGLVLLRVEGAAFCHQMVRSITGTLVEVGRGQRDPASIAATLAARHRSAAGQVAPPQGLCLVGVSYSRQVATTPTDPLP